jgi:uncharacterized protein involved in propanediol utilization
MAIATFPAPRPFAQPVSEGHAFGTFGELLQGVLMEGGRQRHFLVTLPITRGSTVRIVSDKDLPDVQVTPTHKVKSQQLARALLEHFELPPGARLEVDCGLPEGKGLASSSVDLVATGRAIAAHFSLTLSMPLLQSLMRRIEPSDGVMYDGITAFYHRDVELLDRLGSVPPLTIVAVDEGGQVDTVTFNSRAFDVTPREAAKYGELLASMRHAVTVGDLHHMGRIATQSAEINQRRLAKRWLDPVTNICEAVDGLGVVACHSGTCLGILLATEGPSFCEQLALAQSRLRALTGHVLVYQSRSC